MKATKAGICLSVFTLLPGLLSGQTAPALFYSDLDSGPNSGGQSGAGAIVSIYGKDFGAAQGSSYVTIGAGRASSYLLWSDTQVAFQLGSAATTGNITITTTAGSSNGVPFTVRTGNIYFVATTGNDGAAGSYSAPWLTLLHARDTMRPGDITYALNGVTQSRDDGTGWSACMLLDGSVGHSGRAGMPIAMVAYPGATVIFGNVQGTNAGGCDTAVRTKGNGENYWTFAGFTVRGGTVTYNPHGETGWRIIANDMTCPNGNNAAGCLDIQFGTNTYVYGNNIHDVATNLSPGSVTALYHGVYISGHNTGLYFGWNTIARVRGCRGLQQNVNGGEGGSSFDLHIHDNVIHDTQCDGIVMTTVDPSQGTVDLYNNIIYNAGTGPNNVEGSGNWACLYVEGYSFTDSESGVIKVYNNTLYNCGTFASPPYGGGNAGFQWNAGGNAHKSVQLVDNIIYVPSFVPYLVIYAANGERCSGNCPQITGSNNLMFNAGVPPADTYLTGTVNTNPLFVNPSAFDFHLQPGSPAASGGSITPDARDFDGVPLPQGSGYPIGAYALTSGTAPQTFVLTLAASPSVGGTVTPNPQPSNGTYPSGTKVCLTAASNAGWQFSSWTGAALDAANCLIITANVSVTANFTLIGSAPAITLVANAFGAAPLIAPNTWVEIKGSGLAPSNDIRTWQGSDFVNNQLPVQLDGVNVTVNGKPAYVYYISPTQVNILTPPDSLPSQVQVQLANGSLTSNFVTVQARAQSLSFFDFVTANGNQYVYGRHVADNSLIGPPGLLPGLTTTPVKPGETIYIAANGFGPTNVPVVAGALTQSGTVPLPLPAVTIGNIPATVTIPQLIAVGTYQINIVVPSNLPDGDLPLAGTYNGLSIQPNLLITIQH